MKHKQPTKRQKQHKTGGFGLIDALLAFLFLSPLFFLYSNSQLGQKVSIMSASEINQAVSLGENIRLTLIAHGREQLQNNASITDSDFHNRLNQFSTALTQQYQALLRRPQCNPDEPMMSWTGGACSVSRFAVNLNALPYSVQEKGQPINIKITWADQTGNQVYEVRALVGKY